jgi:signal transduction histidine kinase
MRGNYWNWRTLMVAIAFAIVLFCLWFTNKMAADIALEERNKIQIWANAIQEVNSGVQNDFAFSLIESNKTIPAITTDKDDNIIDAVNLPNAKKNQKEYLASFKLQHQPILLDNENKFKIYFGESKLLRQIRFFPLVLLGIVAIFIAIVLIAFRSANNSIQNRVWVGMSKETAHQLGTPLSSLLGWLEYLRSNNQVELANDIQKDVDRLQLVADRFSKIGSVPVLKEENVISRLESIIGYMQKRSPNKVNITLHKSDDEISILLNGALFEWVIENLIRNALDAMQGQGAIDIRIQNQPLEVTIDVSDTGKGISPQNVKKIFKPGFTTKDRGWGLGLSLAKRIINKYHHGDLTVLKSELNVGTTFRIRLRR